MKKIYLLIGSPGSGKTTTMEQIKSKDISHYSIGAMYRQISEENSDFGLKVKNHIDNGQVVPIKIAHQVIERFINEGSDRIVIDGFPSNMEQAVMFENVIEDKAELIKVIELMVDEQEALNRITQRARGVDDDPNKFKERMRIYNDEIAVLRKYYTSCNKYQRLESNAGTANLLKTILFSNG